MKEVSKIVFNNSILKADLNGATLAYQCNWRKIKGEFYSLLLPALYWSIIDSLFAKTSSSSAIFCGISGCWCQALSKMHENDKRKSASWGSTVVVKLAKKCIWKCFFECFRSNSDKGQVPRGLQWSPKTGVGKGVSLQSIHHDSSQGGISSSTQFVRTSSESYLQTKCGPLLNK